MMAAPSGLISPDIVQSHSKEGAEKSFFVTETKPNCHLPAVLHRYSCAMKTRRSDDAHDERRG
jgi:hypothetical protein